MQSFGKVKFRISLRTKLLVLSLAVISVPVVGYQYLKELEQYFRTSLETSLSDSARALAGPLHENYHMFPYSEKDAENSLFIHTLKYPVLVDGYLDDWTSYIDWSNSYRQAGDEKNENRNGSFSYKLILGQREHYLYTLIQVQDDRIIYQQPDNHKLVNGDYIELVIGDEYQVKKNYYFSTSAPGKFNPFSIEQMVTDWEEHEFSRYITNISASWQQNSEGYTVEIAIPLWMLDSTLGFIVNDTDQIENQTYTQIGTAGEETRTKPGKLLRASGEIEKIISLLESTPGRRVWVLDTQGQVMATTGSLERKIDDNPLNLFYTLILPPVTSHFKDDLAGASRLEGEEIQAALRGHTGSRWRSTPDNKAVIVSAATPVWISNQVRGVVVVEETTNNIQMLQRHALVSLFNKTILVFLLITLLMLFYAGRISFRLRRLTQDASVAIDQHGRVTGDIVPSKVNDEIGDLSRSYASMLNRLKQYNTYLEGLAGKLSHELRTPMAVVQSSLENMQSGQMDKESDYLARAKEGINSLNTIMNRLSEAANLEQALHAAEFTTVNIISLLRNCTAGYRLAYPDHEFVLESSTEEYNKEIADDLFVQMLDKLVANAVDFSQAQLPVKIRLEVSNDEMGIEVINYGLILPEDMTGQMFESMVTVRDKKTRDSEIHLGLGLYIARKIAEIHNGTIEARNLPDKDGVSVRLVFPEM